MSCVEWDGVNRPSFVSGQNALAGGRFALRASATAGEAPR
jgi:hypothetical protein